MLVFINYWIET